MRETDRQVADLTGKLTTLAPAQEERTEVKVFVKAGAPLDADLTIRYQVQEMLHAERIFEEQGIQEELDAYNPLVPDGRNLKATMMIEYPDPDERGKRLADLIGIEDKVWLQVAGHGRVWAIADEDLDRENDEKTSAVHFLRFELDEAMAQALKKGAGLTIGVDHPSYSATLEAPSAVRDSLVKDLA